jgi:hypothetical protein
MSGRDRVSKTGQGYSVDAKGMTPGELREALEEVWRRMKKDYPSKPRED